MELSNSTAIQKLRELLGAPQSFLEKEFSPYFYRYYNRYKNPNKFEGYLELCQYLFRVTKAKDSCVLDLGCGFGMMAILLGLHGAKEVVGYDLNTEKIDLFKKLLFHLGLEIKNVRPVLGDSSEIEYPDEYFDVVVTNETLSHVREVENSIDEVYRVLKLGGQFLIRDGNNSLFFLGRIRRRRFWRKIESGPVDPSVFRSTDIPLPFVAVREKMILEKYPQMEREKVKVLSRKTAGLFGNEIFEAVKEFERIGKISKRPEYRYRNPKTGEFPEREINPFELKRMLMKRGFEVSFIPYFYSQSCRNIEMIIKRFYYLLGKYISIFHLFLTPGFALLGRKRRSR
jgi:ubiquinone/menaquinone biosynthesis C-methylase UbiE